MDDWTDPTYADTTTATADAYSDASWNSFDTSMNYQDSSWENWNTATDFQTIANEAWVNGDPNWQTFQDASNDFTQMSNADYAQSWDSWNESQQLWDASYDAMSGSSWEGYTAQDLSQGYSAYDTSFIEPAGAANDASLISDNSMNSML